jgi:hypothetical protein
MPMVIVTLLLQLGCAPAEFNGPQGRFVVWVCPPPVQAPQQEEPSVPPPEERPT